MEVQPVKKYRAPSYPTLEEIKSRNFYKTGAFSTRQKMLIAAATAVLCGTLAGCTPNSGEPATEPQQLPGAPPVTQGITEYEAYNALQNTVVMREAFVTKEIAQTDVAINDDWNEEIDIQEAFNAFIDWMKAEGVV